MKFRFGKYRSWRAFKSYHPVAAKVERYTKIVVISYLALIVMQMIVSWFQMIPLRTEFSLGEERATCIELSPDEYDVVGLDCGGYYDKILTRRKELLRQNGCGLFGSWDLRDGGEVDGFTLWVSGPICLKPFPFGSIITVNAGSTFDHH